MKQFISAVSLVVSDYDQAISFYVEQLGFVLVEDSPLSPTKRWVKMALAKNKRLKI